MNKSISLSCQRARTRPEMNRKTRADIKTAEAEVGLSSTCPPAWIHLWKKEDGTNQHGSRERGEELFHLKCHLLPPRSREIHLADGLSPK